MKHNQRIIAALTSAFFGLLFILMAYEYASLRAHARELCKLKEEYGQYNQAYKKMLFDGQDDTDVNQTLETADADKKKKNDSSTRSPGISNAPSSDTGTSSDLVGLTSLVNRDSSYIKKHAARFGRRHGIENAVVTLYEQEHALITPRKKIIKVHRSSRRTKRPRVTQQRGIRTHSHGEDRQTYFDIIRERVSFVLPLKRSEFWISSPYGPRKKPNGTWGFHYGVDMAASKGTPVMSIADGKVIQAAYAPGYGNTIVIAHGKNIHSRYAHLSKILVTSGDYVTAGTKIGRVGSTGAVWKRKGKDGSHLHLEISTNGKRVNPIDVLMGYL